MAGHHQILNNRHIGNQGEMLINHAYSHFMGSPWVVNRHRLVTDQDLSLVWVVVAHNALDQCAFPRTIFSQDGVEFARLQAQRDVIQCPQRAESLGHAKNFQTWKRIVHHAVIFIKCLGSFQRIKLNSVGAPSNLRLEEEERIITSNVKK